MNSTDLSERPSADSPPAESSSTQANSRVRLLAIGISLVMIVYAVGVVIVVMGVLAFMSMDTAFRPEPCLPFVITPVLIVLVPALIGLLKFQRWGVYVSSLYLLVFGILPGFFMFGSISPLLGLVAGVLPLAIIYWLISRRDEFAPSSTPAPDIEDGYA